ncbi:MAG: tail fiber domain-containing protein [Bacteroidetes bacterium]|nr:tail fiber domain-containing protein [Bacteroidota bacterium]
MKNLNLKKRIICILGILSTQIASAQWTTHEGLRVDVNGIGNGMHTFPWAFPGIVFGNNTGPSPSGEAIGSKRNPGTYSHGLDFHTNYIRRMNITQSGMVNMGAVNVAFPNNDANLEIQSSGMGITAFRVYPLFNNFTNSISISAGGPRALGTNARIAFTGGPAFNQTFDLRATTNGIEITQDGYPSGNISNSKFIADNVSGMILESPTVRLKQYINGIASNKYLTTDATGKIIWSTLPNIGNGYTAGSGISISNNVITNSNPSKWITNGTNIYNGNIDNVGIGTTTPTAKLHTLTNNQTYGVISENNLVGSAIAVSGKATGQTGLGFGGAFEGSNTGVYGNAEQNLNNLTNDQAGNFIYDLKGVHGFASDAGLSNANAAKGIYGEGISASSNGTAYGVYGYASNSNITSGISIGLYGEANNTSSLLDEYALYANGRSYTIGSVWAPSDEKLKSNIQELSNATDIIRRLNAKTYEYKHDGKFANTHLPQGKNYGYLAQDLEKVIPEAVSEAPIFFKDKVTSKQTTEKFKAVNYIALIPILSEAIKEQQTVIESLQNQIDELRTIVAGSSATKPSSSTQEVEAIPSMEGVVLSQNVPNPFTNDTRISYSISQPFKSAKLGVYDLNGQELKLVSLTAVSGDVIIQGGNLKAGMYVYALIIDGKSVATKRMILTSK